MKGRRQALYLALQPICWSHHAEVAVREWEVASRPNKRGLLVFGLSEVLVYGDVLDLVLEKGGVHVEKGRHVD